MPEPTTERSLADETTTPEEQAAPAPAAGPLGNPSGPEAVKIPAASIVDTILNLDELLSADVRRAEKTARFCTKPWLEADIDELEALLDQVTDDLGNPFPGSEQVAEEHALRIQELRVEYGQAFRSVRMAQMSDDDWREFRHKHRDAMAKIGIEPGFDSSPFFTELIAASAKTPAMTIQQVVAIRGKLGEPAITVLGDVAWKVNQESGVSIPKSPTSSHVLRRAQRGRS